MAVILDPGMFEAIHVSESRDSEARDVLYFFEVVLSRAVVPYPPIGSTPPSLSTMRTAV